MLRGQERQRLRPGVLGGDQLVLEEGRRDRAAEIRVDQRPEAPVLPAALRARAPRQLIEHREQRLGDLAVAHRPGDLELGLEHAGRRLLALRRQLDEEAVGAGGERAAHLDEHLVGARLLGEFVRLVDQRIGVLATGDRVGVGRLDLGDGVAVAVRDPPDVGLDVKQSGERRVRLDGQLGLAEGDVGDRLGRRDEQKLRRRPPVDDQGGQRERAGIARLAVLLRNEDEDLADPADARSRKVGAEDHFDDVKEPLAGDFGHRRLADDVGGLQPLEDAQRAVGLGAVERQRRDQRAPGQQPVLPIGDRRRPFRHQLARPPGTRSSPQSVPRPAVSAAPRASAFFDT